MVAPALSLHLGSYRAASGGTDGRYLGGTSWRYSIVKYDRYIPMRGRGIEEMAAVRPRAGCLPLGDLKPITDLYLKSAPDL